MQENQLQMAKLLWEIRLLVLFSFALQVFLFFTGGVRRRTTSKFIRLVIWMAYLGADFVAVYALGFLSRHEDATHQLTFFWAPFLLIHLGGQDTITAFAIEDNNLWLRHLLTLVVQATLALYIFWKSTNGHSMQLIVPSILLFVTGTIKYGERIWALWCGGLESLDNLDSSTFPNYNRTSIESGACYSDIISRALYSMLGVRDVFADFGVYPPSFDLRREEQTVDSDMLPKLLEIELGLMYDDIYTKATVIRTRGGFILRCISLISFVAAFVLFFVSKKQRCNSVDTAITYALFIGGFSLEVCAIFITMMSPWTWLGLLKHREQSGLSRFLLSIVIGWQRKRQLWSDSMGQYSLLNHLGQIDQLQSGLLKRLVMAAIRKVVNLVCGRNQMLWISKLLYTKFVEADKEIMGHVVRRVVQYRSPESSMRQQFPTVGPLLRNILSPPSWGLADVIVGLHTYTELLLSWYSDTSDVARVCRKISNYMLYLLATHPEMLPVKKSLLPFILDIAPTGNLGNNSGRDDVIQRRATAILRQLGFAGPFPEICTEAHLLEIQEVWIGLLIYAAGKSRPEAHAAQLARGGELLTFVWLLMAHHLLGDVHHKIELADIFPHVEGEAIHPAGSPLYGTSCD